MLSSYKSYVYKEFTYTALFETNQDGGTDWYRRAVDASGKEYRLDFTGRSRMSEESFRILVDNNFMDRGSSCVPWNDKSLKEYKEDKIRDREFSLNNKSLTEL